MEKYVGLQYGRLQPQVDWLSRRSGYSNRQTKGAYAGHASDLHRSLQLEHTGPIMTNSKGNNQGDGDSVAAARSLAPTRGWLNKSWVNLSRGRVNN